MNKKLVALVLVTVIAFAAAGVGTMAWFTSQATSEANSFQAGTLSIGTGTGNQFASIVVNDMAPGLPVHQGTTTLQNNGSLPLKLYRINASNIIDEGGLDAVLDVEAFIDGISVYTGKLSLLVQENGGFFNPIMNIAAGKEMNLELVVTMNESAGNIYQNKQLKCDFTILAAQEEMPLPGQTDGWTNIANSDGGSNRGFSVDGRNSNNSIEYRFNWRENPGVLFEQADIYVKHQTGDVDSHVQLIRLLILTQKVEVEEGVLDANDISVNWLNKVITINKNALPEEWKIIDVKFGGKPSAIGNYYATDYVGWHLNR